MSEIRQNLISREWVIIASDKGLTPRDYVDNRKADRQITEHKSDCLFCPGNESRVEQELFCLGSGKGWRVKVVPNKFGVLSAAGKGERVVNGTFHSMAGYGAHEIVIEHPKHNFLIAFASEEDVSNILRAYKNRYEVLGRDKNIEAVTIFKNHGLISGSSIEHAYSQIIATTIVPPQVRTRLEHATGYFDDTGRCVFCNCLADELRAKERIVLESAKFVSFVPYAAFSPFHLWIFPKRHMASFSEIDEEEIRDLAKVLKVTLMKVYRGLNNPDYNYTVRSIPTKEKNTAYFHWYISLIPRVNSSLGFEFGSGMYINTSLPEKNAKYLREINVEQ